MNPGRHQAAPRVDALGGRGSGTRANRRDLPTIDLQVDEITVGETRVDKREAHLHSPRKIPALSRVPLPSVTLKGLQHEVSRIGEKNDSATGDLGWKRRSQP